MAVQNRTQNAMDCRNVRLARRRKIVSHSNARVENVSTVLTTIAGSVSCVPSVVDAVVETSAKAGTVSSINARTDRLRATSDATRILPLTIRRPRPRSRPTVNTVIMGISASLDTVPRISAGATIS